MLRIPVKEEEPIEKVLKKYKKKFEKVKILRELRNRKNFTKPSISRRQEIIKATYKESMCSSEF